MHCNNTIPFVSNHSWRSYGWHIQSTYFKNWAFSIPPAPSLPQYQQLTATLTNHTTAATGVVRPRAKQLGRPGRPTLKKIGTSQQDTWDPPIPPTNSKVTTIPQETIFGEWERDAPVALPLWLASNYQILRLEEMHAISNRSLSITYYICT